MSGPRTTRVAVRDLTVIAMVAVMIVIGKTLLRMPISVSGHAGVLWIAAMVVGRGVVRRNGAATLMGIVGGTLVALLQPNSSGMLLTIAKYVVPGMLLDVTAPLLGNRFAHLVPAVFAGALAHAGKVVVDLVQGLIAGVPAAALALGLTATLALHVAFGALGGLLGALILKGLVRARIPQLADHPATAEHRAPGSRPDKTVEAPGSPGTG